MRGLDHETPAQNVTPKDAETLMKEFVDRYGVWIEEDNSYKESEEWIKSAFVSYAAHLVSVMPEFYPACSCVQAGRCSCGTVAKIKSDTVEDCRSAIKREAGIEPEA